jgi:hypothetical protein
LCARAAGTGTTATGPAPAEPRRLVGTGGGLSRIDLSAAVSAAPNALVGSAPSAGLPAAWITALQGNDPAYQ